MWSGKGQGQLFRREQTLAVAWSEVSSHAMRLLLFAALLAVTAGASSANTPLVRVGASNDAWERPHVQSRDCTTIPEQQQFAPAPRQMASAIRRLQRTSVRALSDRDAGQLLGVERDDRYPDLAQQLMSDRISALAEQRRLVFEERHGSWSRADDQNLDALRERLERFHERSLAFYLVRALAADATHISRIDVWVCGQTVLTRSFPASGVGSRGHPDRLGLVVLIDAIPERSVAEWTYDDPTLNR